MTARKFTLVKPNYRFAGFARTEWQIFTYISANGRPECVRYGFNSRMIFSGTYAECLTILEGQSYSVRGYRSGAKLAPGHYSASGLVTISKIEG